MIKHTLFCLLILTTILCACTKAPDFPPEPTIEFGEIINNNVRQGDSVFITINFTDGDGDIGLFEENRQNLFLVDTRPSQNNYIERLVMPPVPELGSENGISGEIRFHVSPCCEQPSMGINSCTPISDEFPDFQLDTLVYEMYIEDRAGNKSNTITLDPIFLLCD